MTCDEYKRTITETDPLSATTATIAAIMRHAADCSACADWSRARIDAHRKEMSVIDLNIMRGVAHALIQKVVDDPEALAVARKE